MRKRNWIVVSAVLVAVAAGVSLYSQGRNTKETAMPAAVAFRVLLGVGDKEPTDWDGSVTVSPGRIENIQGMHFRGPDSTDSRSKWKASSGLSLTPVGRAYAGMRAPVLPNGIIISAASDDANATFQIKTRQGDFSFQAREVPFGARKQFLDGRVVVDRVPDTIALANSPEDQDFPAIAQSDDAVYVSYVEFVRGDRRKAKWGNLGETAAPKDLSFVARPVGGDQVFLMRYSKAKRTWSAPVPVSDAKQDVMRTAVAVDGSKRVWVFWSDNRNGNFDIYAKYNTGGRWSSEMRLTTDEGTDLDPVAATDASGRVWIAWQGLRNGNLEVLSAVQAGDRFSGETTVSFSKASDWEPAIAASSNGEVSVSWDTYDKGDYDVYFRRLKFEGGIRMDAPIPVAASQDFEARSSIAYDKQNRLWVAYEISDAKWGKDNGPYDRNGIPLYWNHNVRVKCYQGSSVYLPAEESLMAVLPKAVAPRPAGNSRKKDGKKQVADEHDTSGPRGRFQGLNSVPRIAVDPNGLVYLAFRYRVQPGRTPAGTVWVDQMVYFDGATWKGPVFMPHTDQWIENRPAMVAIAPGDLMMALAADNRYAEMLRDKRPGGKDKNAVPDSINGDIYAAEMVVKDSPQPAQLKAVAMETVSAPDPEAHPERDQVAMMRNYRASLGSEQLGVLRGEFHRHTDLSYDGSGDGSILDAYRYMIDAASMDWGGCCDHDNGTGEYPWWIQQKLTDAYHLGDKYIPMFSYERSVSYPEGHRNPVFVERGIRPLPRLPKVSPNSAGHAPDTQMLYEYLRKYDGIVASHTSGTDMGTDWRDNDPILEPVVEIYQGCRQNYEMPDAPRSMSEKNAIGGWRPLGFVSLALKKGYRLGFESSSDHGSTHISYCNLWVTKRTREGVMEAFHKRRVYGATDNILADVRCGEHFMGEEFTTSQPPSISVKLTGTADFAKVHIIRDGEYVYSVEPKKREVDFVWKDNAAQRGRTSYYYVRGEQADGELVWVSPMWITYK